MRTVDSYTAYWSKDGENFTAAPIERIISRHASVSQVAVYAVPDADAAVRGVAAGLTALVAASCGLPVCARNPTDATPRSSA